MQSILLVDTSAIDYAELTPLIRRCLSRGWRSNSKRHVQKISNRTRPACNASRRVVPAVLARITLKDEWPRQTFSLRNSRARTETGSNVGRDRRADDRLA
jgi:hypothetical protein